MKDVASAWVDPAQLLPEDQDRVLVCLKLPTDGKPGLYELAIYRSKGRQYGFYSLSPASWPTNYSQQPKLIDWPNPVVCWTRIPSHK